MHNSPDEEGDPISAKVTASYSMHAFFSWIVLIQTRSLPYVKKRVNGTKKALG